MQRMTLLQITQNILSAMSSDAVNSITDTVESQQVAEEVRTTFYELYGNRDIASFEGLVNLEPSGNPDTPHVLKIPENIAHIKWVKYRNWRSNDKAHYFDVKYLEPEEFINRIVSVSEGLTTPYVDVKLTPTSTVRYPLRANEVPSYYTVFDNEQALVFDSFDQEYESNLTANNSLAWGVGLKKFELTDDFIPPIPTNLFSHFLHECRAACFVNIKEVANQKEEQRARRQLVRSQTRLVKSKDQREGVFKHHDYSRKR